LHIKTKKIYSKIEFRDFKYNAGKILLAHSGSQRFKEVKEKYNIVIDLESDRAFQISLGSIPIDYLKDENKFIIETGGCLLYTMASNGIIAVVLYPAKSEAEAPIEDNILLRMGYFTSWQLQNFLENDLEDLAAYSFATNMYRGATFREYMRVLWLRRAHPLTVDGNFKHPRWFGYAGRVSEFTFRMMVLSLLKPVALVIIIVLLIGLGWENLLTYLPK